MTSNVTDCFSVSVCVFARSYLPPLESVVMAGVNAKTRSLKRGPMAQVTQQTDDKT
jgi:hypothetical protein